MLPVLGTLSAEWEGEEKNSHSTPDAPNGPQKEFANSIRLFLNLFFTGGPPQGLPVSGSSRKESSFPPEGSHLA